jgi:3',5'-cyclic-AMP phosphodiesterase
VRIVQISDPHVTVEPNRYGYDGAAALADVLAHVAALQPRAELVLFTGDLTEHGVPEEYVRFREVTDGFALPMAAIPGNHDRRDAFAEGLAGSAVRIGAGPYLQLAVDVGPVRAIGLDTLGLEGDPAGYLDRDRLRWLDARLDEDRRPAVVFMHHPPFRIGQRIADASCCRDGEALAAVLDDYPQVLAVVCGHVHRIVQLRWAGRIGSIAPAVAWEVPLDPLPDAPIRLVPQPPAFQILDWSPERGLVILAVRLDAAGL